MLLTFFLKIFRFFSFQKVVRNIDEWNKVVEAIGQHTVTNSSSSSSGNHPTIIPPVDFANNMLLIVSISGHFNETFWPKPLQRIKDVTDMGNNLACCVKMMRTENAGWMSMAAVPQSEKPVMWYFDQQEDWADAVQTFYLEPSQQVGARQIDKTPSRLVQEERHPAKQLDMYLELLVDSGMVRKFGRSVRQLTRNLEDGRFKIEQLIDESPILLPGHLGLTLLRESAFRALPKVPPRVVAPAASSRDTPPASPGRGSRGGDPGAGAGGSGGGGADGVGAAGRGGGAGGAGGAGGGRSVAGPDSGPDGKPRVGPRTKVGRKPHAAWLLGQYSTPPHTRHGSPVSFDGSNSEGDYYTDDGGGMVSGESDYTDSGSESDGGGSHDSGGSSRDGSAKSRGQDSGIHAMEHGYDNDTPIFFPADVPNGGGGGGGGAAAGTGTVTGTGTGTSTGTVAAAGAVINDAHSSGSGGSSSQGSRARRRRRRRNGRKDNADSVSGILEEVSRVLTEEQGLAPSKFPPVESLGLLVVKKEDGDGGDGSDAAAVVAKVSTSRAKLPATTTEAASIVRRPTSEMPQQSKQVGGAGVGAGAGAGVGAKAAAKPQSYRDWAGKPWASRPMNGELEQYMRQLYAQPSHDANAVLAYPSWYFREYEMCYPEHHRAMVTAAAAQRAAGLAAALAAGKRVFDSATGQWAGGPAVVPTAANVAAAAAAAAAADHCNVKRGGARVPDGVDAVGSDVDTSDHGSVSDKSCNADPAEETIIQVRKPRTAASAKAKAAARKAAAAALKAERDKAEAAAKAKAAKEEAAREKEEKEAAARAPPLSPLSMSLPSGGIIPNSKPLPVPTTVDEARRIAADAAKEAADAAAAAEAADPAEAKAAMARGCPPGCTCPASMAAMQQRHATLIPAKLQSAATPATSTAAAAYYPQGYGGGYATSAAAASKVRSPAPAPTTRSYQFFHTDVSTVAIIGSDLNCCKEGCEHGAH